MPRIKDEDLVTPALLRRFEAEARISGVNDKYYALIELANGRLISHHPFGPPLVAEQIMWAADVLKRLNRELHHDGAWTVVFTDPKPPEAGELAVHASAAAGHREYARYALLWLDRDGDVQFAIEWVRDESELLDWTDVLMAGIESVMAKCETAWEIWKMNMIDVLDTVEGQTFKRAKGQAAASTRH